MWRVIKHVNYHSNQQSPTVHDNVILVRLCNHLIHKEYNCEYTLVKKVHVLKQCTNINT